MGRPVSALHVGGEGSISHVRFGAINKKNLKETPKGEWTTQEVADYANYCEVDQVSQ